MGTKARLENVSEMSPNHWEVKLYALGRDKLIRHREPDKKAPS